MSIPNLLSLPNSAYTPPSIVLSSLSSISTNTPANTLAYIPFQTISLYVSTSPPTTRDRRGRRDGKQRRSSRRSRRADRGEKSTALQDSALTSNINRTLKLNNRAKNSLLEKEVKIKT